MELEKVHCVNGVLDCHINATISSVVNDRQGMKGRARDTTTPPLATTLLHSPHMSSLLSMSNLRPDMVPITVRSDLPQLRDISIEKVLCGTNLTWDEFLHLFHVSLDPTLHIVKGSGGRRAHLLDKVGDYVKILKRRMKVYLVNVELLTVKKSCNSNSSVSSGVKTIKNGDGNSKRVRKRKGGVDGDLTRSDPLDDLPEKSVSMETQVFNSPPPTIKKTKKKRPTTQNTQISPNEEEEALNLINLPVKLRSTLLDFNTNTDFPLNFSNNQSSGSSNVDNCCLDDSNSNLSVGEFDIKPQVVQFLVHKISNKNMLRIRDELTQLKNSDDYFKLTSVAPLAAGLLEQMFCRGQKEV